MTISHTSFITGPFLECHLSDKFLCSSEQKTLDNSQGKKTTKFHFGTLRILLVFNSPFSIWTNQLVHNARIVNTTIISESGPCCKCISHNPWCRIQARWKTDYNHKVHIILHPLLTLRLTPSLSVNWTHAVCTWVRRMYHFTMIELHKCVDLISLHGRGSCGTVAFEGQKASCQRSTLKLWMLMLFYKCVVLVCIITLTLLSWLSLAPPLSTQAWWACFEETE